MSEMESSIPEGWADVLLRDVAQPSKEKVEPSDRPDEPYLSLEHIDPDDRTLNGRGVSSDVKSTKTVFRVGDVLYGKLRPYLNKVYLAEFDGICSTDILVFPGSETVHSGYLTYFLNSPEVVRHATQASKGVSLPRVSFSALGKLPFALPPYAEQERIVGAADTLLARVHAVRDRLDRVPAIIRRFRQSVLAAACDGRLTEDWRAAYPDTESADALLDRIDAERGQRLGKKYKAPTEPDTADLGDLPEGWTQRHLDSLLEAKRSISYGVVKPGPHDPNGVPLLKSGQVRDGYMELTDGHRITPDLDSQYERTRVLGGEVLLNLVGASIGRSCIAPEEAAGSNLSRAIALIPTWPGLNRWVQLNLRGPVGQQLIQAKTGGSAQPVLNLREVRTLIIPVPPAEERDEIIRRADELLALADRVEARVEVARHHADHTAQAVLAKAFRGELVPTEAELARAEARDYETADALLARVAAETKTRKAALKSESPSQPRPAPDLFSASADAPAAEEIPGPLRTAAEEGAWTTPRGLLSWFGQKRRGAIVVDRVRAALDEIGAETQPDFEEAGFDDRIRITTVQRL